MFFDSLALLSLLVFILLLTRFVNIFPSLMACMARWKESTNLEASVKLSRDRSILAIAMIIPFCLIITRFKVYFPSYMSGMNETERIAVTAAAFIIYWLFRSFAYKVCQPHKMKGSAYITAHKVSFTFFIILTLLLLIISGILSFLNVEILQIRDAILWISGLIYLLYIIRKTQILISSCSFFTAFLYLCALEIIPTGTLVVSAVIF